MLREPYAVKIYIKASQKDCLRTLPILEVKLGRERWNMLVLRRGIDVHMKDQLKS